MIWQTLTPGIGSQLDFAGTHASAGWRKELREALIERGLLILRGLRLSVADLLDLAAILGEPIADPHPVTIPSQGSEFVTTLRNDAEHPPVLNHWHSDASFCQAPPRYSLLSCRALPDQGGDTIWLSTSAAYAALAKNLQEQCRDKQALHRLPEKSLTAYAANTTLERLQAQLHPLIIRQGGSGRPCLFANRLYTRSIVDDAGRTHRRLLVQLLRSLENPEWQYRHRWQIGDVAIWDNQSTQHYAVADYYPQTREMWRISIASEQPQAA